MTTILITKLKLNWDKNDNKNRVEIYNLKNEACQAAFKKETSSEYNNHNLSAILDTKDDLNVVTNKFIKKLENIIKRCFKKVRIKEKKTDDKEVLYKKWKDLKNKTDVKSKAELKEVENTLADKYARDNFEKIKQRTGNTDSEDGGLKKDSLWNLKKELFPQTRDPPTAMIDPETGNLLTTDENIQQAALKNYAKRLENEPIKDSFKHIKEAKEILCEKLLKVAKTRKTPPWKMRHLERVLKYLKKEQNQDPTRLLQGTI